MAKKLTSRKKLLYTLFILCLAFSTRAIAQNFSTHLYKEEGGRKLFLDVFRPQNNTSKKSPVIILFHGGALSAGQKEIMHDQCRFFSQMGMLAISPSYYLVPKKTTDFKTEVAISVEDARSALQWVIANAKMLGIDLHRIAIGGASAGGFLASAATLTNEKNNIPLAVKVKALVLYNPAYSPKTRYTPDVVQLITKNTPPAIILFGTKDSYKLAGDEFYNQLAQYQIKSEMWTAAGQSHSFYKKPNWAKASNAKVFNFLCTTGVVKGKQLPDYEDAVFRFQDPISP